MRDDRIPFFPSVKVEEPTGTVEEMDVVASPIETAIVMGLKAYTAVARPGYILEPWVRVARRDDWTLSAGISVSRNETDDGA